MKSTTIQNAIGELRNRAWKQVKRESELGQIAKRIWPKWQSFQEEWMLYEYTQGPDGKESGYGYVRFGIGGYDDAAVMLVMKRLQTDRRYELSLIVHDDDYHFARINCETGEVKYSAGFPQGQEVAE